VHLPKVILFDAAGTLFHLPKGVGWHYADVARRHGGELDPSAVQKAFRAAWKNAPPAVETASGPRTDDDRGWWRALVEQVLDATGIHHMDRDAYFSELWMEFTKPGVWELFPEVREVLGTLGNRYRLGVLSNFDSRLHTILADLGIAHFFEHVIVSSEVGADKPSLRMFAEAADRFDAAPDMILHVGDDPEADWGGGRAAGVRVFELRRPDSTLRDLATQVETLFA
jgi:putative hydrolase of the HAD superfamily